MTSIRKSNKLKAIKIFPLKLRLAKIAKFKKLMGMDECWMNIPPEGKSRMAMPSEKLKNFAKTYLITQEAQLRLPSPIKMFGDNT